MARAIRRGAEEAFRAPFTDSHGRIRYIVELAADAANAYRDIAAPQDGFASWHKPEVRGLVAALAARHGFKPESITSWIGPSFSAYLSEKDLAQLKTDPLVTRITQDRRLVFSALWSDTTSGSETTSWGTRALGGPDLSPPGSSTVYVLDAGVGYHTDLTRVSERVATNPSLNAVGCYPHATHVAGIVGAEPNYVGSVGVRPSTYIVSVALVGENLEGASCSLSSLSENNYLLGLDLIRQRITQSGRVGIVNISSNSNPGWPSVFAQSQPVGAALKSLATPAPGYPGAFVVQSAGNFFGDACLYAFDGPQRPGAESDGIMVVGAIDANGQPVSPLNSLEGFRNLPHANDQPGSNFGTCVETWAPGNSILSTWASDPQQSTFPPAPYSTVQRLSGTSMAAPHVGALAASLAASQNLQTPAQIEAAVRARLRDLGSKDESNRSVKLPILSGSPGTAQPTAEFLIGSDGIRGINGNITRYSDQSFPLRYDTVGAQNCNLTGYRNGVVWYTAPNAGAEKNWGNIKLIPARYRWEIDCFSPQGTHSYAQASATIQQRTPGPTAKFYVNGQDTATGPTLGYTFNSSTRFGLRYASSGADYCNLVAKVNNIEWYSINHFVTSYDWGNENQLNPDSYYWQVTCFDANGKSAVAGARINVLP
ncbi:MAG: S8 family serine peptidase [Betaproteobacteria bacterium]|nr:S8 family serine peptidase [Betaproteobacteria bacterium]